MIVIGRDKVSDILDKKAEPAAVCQSGETVVITAGVPLGKSGSTNLIKAQVIDEDAM